MVCVSKRIAHDSRYVCRVRKNRVAWKGLLYSFGLVVVVEQDIETVVVQS